MTHKEVTFLVGVGVGGVVVSARRRRGRRRGRSEAMSERCHAQQPGTVAAATAGTPRWSTHCHLTPEIMMQTIIAKYQF